MVFYHKISYSAKGKLIIKHLHMKYLILLGDFYIRLTEQYQSPTVQKELTISLHNLYTIKGSQYY